MKRFLLSVACLLLVVLGAATTQAMTLVARSFDELVARADTVFKGQVAAKTSLWVGDGESRHIATRVTFQVEESYKGDASPEQTLEFVGGTVEGTTLKIPGMPEFEVGQVAMLFVVGNGVQFCPLVGVTQGRFHVVKDAASGTEQVFTDDHLPVANTAALGQFDEAGIPRLKHLKDNGAQPMTAAAFKAEIIGKVATLAH